MNPSCTHPPCRRRVVLLALGAVAALAFGTGPAQAGDVHVYRAGQTPDPAVVARVLIGTPTARGNAAPRIKMRGGPASNEPVADEAMLLPDPAPARELAWVDAGREALRDWQAQQPASGQARGEPVALLVPFAHNSARIPRQAEAALAAVARGMQQAGASAYLIEGHTSATGGLKHNLGLSYRRAHSVKRYLVQHFGMAPAQLKLAGLGPTRPLDPRHPEAAVNRRVQFRAL